MTPPTATSNRVCAACTVCGSEQYPSVQCANGNALQDRVCTTCTTCTASQYETVACAGGTTNRVCTPLTNCVAGQRQTVAPTPTTNRTCAPCTTCTATQHETMMCADGNTSQDRVCIENMGTCTIVAIGDGETNNFSGSNTNTNATTMRTSSDGATRYNAFVQFGVASAACLEGGTIPANVTVLGATLSLTLITSGGGSPGHDVRRVTAAWSEASLPVNGGDGPATSGVISASFSPPAAGSAVAISGAGIVNDVQFFLGTPGSDFGFLISKSSGSTASGMQNAWATRNDTMDARRPRLVITYMTN